MADDKEKSTKIGWPPLLGGNLVATNMEKELMSLQHASDIEYYEREIAALRAALKKK